MMTTRIYRVTVNSLGDGWPTSYLVNAPSKAVAENYAKALHIEAHVATQDDLISLTKDGVLVIDVKVE